MLSSLFEPQIHTHKQSIVHRVNIGKCFIVGDLLCIHSNGNLGMLKFPSMNEALDHKPREMDSSSHKAVTT